MFSIKSFVGELFFLTSHLSPLTSCIKKLQTCPSFTDISIILPYNRRQIIRCTFDIVVDPIKGNSLESPFPILNVYHTFRKMFFRDVGRFLE